MRVLGGFEREHTLMHMNEAHYRRLVFPCLQRADPRRNNYTNLLAEHNETLFYCFMTLNLAVRIDGACSAARSFPTTARCVFINKAHMIMLIL